MVFKGKNGLTAKNIFNSRRDYKYLAVPKTDIPLIDFWYDDSLYGKVDTLGNAIYPIIDSAFVMTQLSLNEEPLTTMFFVDEAYSKFKSYYTDLIAANLVDPLPAYDIFTIKKTITPLEEVYSKHISELMGFFVDVYLPKFDKCIRNFDNFITYFLRFMQEHGLSAPVTKTGYIMMPTTPNSISGLVLDLEHGPQSVDMPKQEFFKGTKCSYETFQYHAARYGFLIDKNSPWRLVANVTSPQITPPLYGQQSQDHVFEKYYFKSYKEDMHSLFYFIFNSYVLYFTKRPYIFYSGQPGGSKEFPVGVSPSNQKTSNIAGQTSSSVYRRTLESIKYDLQNSTFWYELLLRVRLLETVKDRQTCNKLVKRENRSGNYLTGSLMQRLNSINEIVKSNDVRISKENLFLDKYSRTSVTSNNENHRHIYRIDENGNGWAEYAYHPDEPRIKHRHEIRNYQVLSAKSDCYPNCKKIFNYSGVPDHIHQVDIQPGSESETLARLYDPSSTRRIPFKNPFASDQLDNWNTHIEKLKKTLEYREYVDNPAGVEKLVNETLRKINQSLEEAMDLQRAVKASPNGILLKRRIP
jgi:hypothetical protein